jgi:hypothetical protein
VRGALAGQLVRKGRPQEALALLQSFDQTLEDAGQPPYFTARIDAIKRSLGQTVAPAAPAMPMPAGPVALAGEYDVPLVAVGGVLQVPVVVDDTVKATFYVDSGASMVNIPFEMAQSLFRAGQLTRSDYLGTARTTVATGEHVLQQGFMLHSLRVGDRELHNIPALVGSRNGPLLLGQSFLHRFKSWSIDNHRRVLVLRD